MEGTVVGGHGARGQSEGCHEQVARWPDTLSVPRGLTLCLAPAFA